MSEIFVGGEKRFVVNAGNQGSGAGASGTRGGVMGWGGDGVRDGGAAAVETEWSRGLSFPTLPGH